jgi:D-amino-acid dehydrogenase
LQRSTRKTIGVIGGGIVGISCALFLQRSGHVVEVIDYAGPGEGASSGNAGIIALSEVVPLSTMSTLAQLPSLLLSKTSPLRVRASYLPRAAPWLLRFVLACREKRLRAIETALNGLLSNSWASWTEIVRGTDGEHLLSRAGWLQVFETAASLARRQTTINRKRRFGILIEEVGPAEIRQLEPALAPRFAGGLYYPKNGLVHDPLKMVQALAESFVATGGAYHRERVMTIDPAQENQVKIQTDTARRNYDAIVVAAGAWSRSLVRALGYDMPLDTERGYHLMLEKPRATITRSVNFPDHGFSLTPIGDAIRLTSGLEFAGLNAHPDFRRIQRLTRHASQMIPELVAVSTSQWLGFRPSFPDSLPVIGALRDHPGVVVAFGHGHLGLTAGPFTGSLVASIMGGVPLPIDMSPFSPDRWR